MSRVTSFCWCRCSRFFYWVVFLYDRYRCCIFLESLEQLVRRRFLLGVKHKRHFVTALVTCKSCILWVLWLASSGRSVLVTNIKWWVIFVLKETSYLYQHQPNFSRNRRLIQLWEISSRTVLEIVMILSGYISAEISYDAKNDEACDRLKTNEPFLRRNGTPVDWYNRWLEMFPTVSKITITSIKCQQSLVNLLRSNKLNYLCKRI